MHRWKSILISCWASVSSWYNRVFRTVPEETPSVSPLRSSSALPRAPGPRVKDVVRAVMRVSWGTSTSHQPLVVSPGARSPKQSVRWPIRYGEASITAQLMGVKPPVAPLVVNGKAIWRSFAVPKPPFVTTTSSLNRSPRLSGLPSSGRM